MRTIAAILAGLAVGVATDFGVNALVHGSPPHGYGSMQSLTGLSGGIAGVLAGFAALFVVLALRLPDKGRRNVWGAVSVGFLMLGLLFPMWVLAIGGPPGIWTLEGAWIYPTCTVLFGLGALGFVKARRITRSLRQAPGPSMRDDAMEPHGP